MDATFDVFVTSKKIVTVWPPFGLVSGGGILIFNNYSDDRILVEGISGLVEDKVEPIPAHSQGRYQVRDNAPKGGYSFKIKVKMNLHDREQDVQLYAVTESDDPEIIIT